MYKYGKILQSAVVVVFVSGCVSFVPTFDAALFQHLEAVNDDLSKINAAVSVVYAEPPPFSKVESFYVDAVAHLSEAQAIASGQRDYYQGRMAEGAAVLIQQAIANCNDALVIQMTRHRQAPINKETLAVFAVTEACSTPRLMVGRLKEDS